MQRQPGVMGPGRRQQQRVGHTPGCTLQGCAHAHLRRPLLNTFSRSEVILAFQGGTPLLSKSFVPSLVCPPSERCCLSCVQTPSPMVDKSLRTLLPPTCRWCPPTGVASEQPGPSGGSDQGAPQRGRWSPATGGSDCRPQPTSQLVSGGSAPSLRSAGLGSYC